MTRHKLIVGTAVIVAAALMLVSLSVAAAANLFMPSPLGAAITIGQWVLSRDTAERVYYIRVEGRGATDAQARQDGFRIATEQAVGSLILAETQVSDQNLVRRDIIEYSSGYVDKYKILNVRNDGQYVAVEMDVWIKGSQIANRLLSAGIATREIEGERIGEQVRSLQRERRSGDRVLGTVLADFPERAFDVVVEGSEAQFSFSRQLNLAIPVTLKWNTEYLSAFYETMERTAQEQHIPDCVNNCKHAFVVTMHGKLDRMFFNHWFNTFGFSDRFKYDDIYRAFINNRPIIMLTLRNGGGRAVYRACYGLDELNVRQMPVLFHFDRDRVLIDGRNQIRGTIGIYNVTNIDQVTDVEAKVVRPAACPRN